MLGSDFRAECRAGWKPPPSGARYETRRRVDVVGQTRLPSRRDSISKPSDSSLGRRKWEIPSPLQRTAGVS